mmetsp:Transcript_59242/g.176215  ORF Transcript_59242/g.176215 Transcript_59242/m.176215 type:complete len:230 (+) Transcript_59242:643-1332(+)
MGRGRCSSAGPGFERRGDPEGLGLLAEPRRPVQLHAGHHLRGGRHARRRGWGRQFPRRQHGRHDRLQGHGALVRAGGPGLRSAGALPGRGRPRAADVHDAPRTRGELREGGVPRGGSAVGEAHVTGGAGRRRGGPLLGRLPEHCSLLRADVPGPARCGQGVRPRDHGQPPAHHQHLQGRLHPAGRHAGAHDEGLRGGAGHPKPGLRLRQGAGLRHEGPQGHVRQAGDGW